MQLESRTVIQDMNMMHGQSVLKPQLNPPFWELIAALQQSGCITSWLDHDPDCSLAGVHHFRCLHRVHTVTHNRCNTYCSCCHRICMHSTQHVDSFDGTSIYYAQTMFSCYKWRVIWLCSTEFGTHFVWQCCSIRELFRTCHSAR